MGAHLKGLDILTRVPAHDHEQRGAHRSASTRKRLALALVLAAVYLVAEVVRVSEQGRDGFGQPVFVVGCRFTNRISEPVEQLEEQAV